MTHREASPRVIARIGGVLYLIIIAIGVFGEAGVCYLVNSFALLVAPAVANRLFPAILLPSFVGELSFGLWLLVKGVNAEQWKRWEGSPV